MYLVSDLLEENFQRLPLKSILKFKPVSKQWRSILESKSFAERRISLQKNRWKILAAELNRNESTRFKGDEEVDVVYLNCDDVTRPSLTCEGLVCIPEPGSVNVLNPSTGEFLSFPSGPNPVTKHYQTISDQLKRDGRWCNHFRAYWAMGFGRDKVNGSYKVVRMFFDPNRYCEILDVNIGEWRNSNPPLYLVDARRKSAYVNGSIYWLSVYPLKLLALDLHTEEFLDVLTLPPYASSVDQLVNLDDRLAIAKTYMKPFWRLEIWTMDDGECGWSMTYSIPLSYCRDYLFGRHMVEHFRPVTVSKQENVFFHDNEKRLLKYYPKMNLLRCVSQETWVISPFVENLVSLRPQNLDHVPGSQLSKFVKRMKLRTPTLLLTVSLVFLVVFRYYVVSSRS